MWSMALGCISACRVSLHSGCDSVLFIIYPCQSGRSDFWDQLWVSRSAFFYMQALLSVTHLLTKVAHAFLHSLPLICSASNTLHWEITHTSYWVSGGTIISSRYWNHIVTHYLVLYQTHNEYYSLDWTTHPGLEESHHGFHFRIPVSVCSILIEEDEWNPYIIKISVSTIKSLKCMWHFLLFMASYGFNFFKHFSRIVFTEIK